MVDASGVDQDLQWLLQEYSNTLGYAVDDLSVHIDAEMITTPYEKCRFAVSAKIFCAHEVLLSVTAHGWEINEVVHEALIVLALRIQDRIKAHSLHDHEDVVRGE